MEEKEEEITLDGKQVTIKTFIGVYNKTMPLLRKEGFRPATLEEILELMLNKALSLNGCYTSVTSIHYPATKKISFKIIPYSESLASITPQTKLHRGGIIKTQTDYKKLIAQEFAPESQIKPFHKKFHKNIEYTILDKPLTKKQALEHKGWLAALDNNKKLLEKIVEYFFNEVYNVRMLEKAMGFYLRGLREGLSASISIERPLCIYGLSYIKPNWCFATDDDCNLHIDVVNLVGIKDKT